MQKICPRKSIWKVNIEQSAQRKIQIENLQKMTQKVTSSQCYRMFNLRHLNRGNIFRNFNDFNSSSQTGFNMSGPQKIQTLVKVRQGQYKTFLLL